MIAALDRYRRRYPPNRRPPAPAPRHGLPMPGPVVTDPAGRLAARMACYARLWQRALIVAERKLRGARLP